MKTLGIMGGMGPLATAFYMELVTRMTDAEGDSEQIPMVVYNRTTVPDRTAYIMGRSDKSPTDEIRKGIQGLERDGADVIGVPCVTSHYFYKEFTEGSSVKVLNMVDETVARLRSANVKKVGIMATEGTVKCGYLQSTLKAAGIEAIVPDERGQQKVMDIIYKQIKANRPADVESFLSVSAQLHDNGAEVVLLGCTELSLVRRDVRLGAGFLDMLEVLALRSVEECGATIKPDYAELFRPVVCF